LIDLKANRAFELEPIYEDRVRSIDMTVERDRQIGIGVCQNEAGAQGESVAIGYKGLRVGIGAQGVKMVDERSRCGSHSNPSTNNHVAARAMPRP
jgi:hypothetical protein